MRRGNEWEAFFNGYATLYMQEVFTKNTVKEVDFVIEELKIRPGHRILDMGCGTGRHSIELAKRGYKVTGVDISSGMLAEAEKAANDVGVRVEWIHADATEFKSGKKFDGAISLCEGAFGLLGSNDHPIEHDLTILSNISVSLKPMSRLILTTLNGFEKVRKCTQKEVEEGKFDPIMMVDNIVVDWDTPEGKKSSLVRERGYVPTELFMLFQQAGFDVEHIWGGTAGNWGRRKISLDEIEIMVVARKQAKKTFALDQSNRNCHKGSFGKKPIE
nr:class I SAM-dependent methyltransferase [Candidatus Njordarchaeota archaeon]